MTLKPQEKEKENGLGSIKDLIDAQLEKAKEDAKEQAIELVEKLQPQTPTVKPPVTTVKPVTPVTSTKPIVSTPVTTINTPVVQQPKSTPTVEKQWIKGLTNFQTGLLGFGLLAGTATLIIVVATPTKKGKK